MIRIVIMWILTIGGASLVAAHDLSLSYGKPAVNWHEALPLGNGRLGGMFFGCTTNERVKAAKGRGWSAYSTTNPFGGSSRWGVHRPHSAWLMKHLWVRSVASAFMVSLKPDDIIARINAHPRGSARGAHVILC